MTSAIGNNSAPHYNATQMSRRSAHSSSEPTALAAETNLGSASKVKTDPAGRVLTEDQLREIKKLEQRDREVRRHEQAHVAAAGSLAQGGPKYEYTRGPDGKQYVTNGEVPISAQTASNNPQATLAKAQQIRRAALAPADPSGHDRAVAAQAAAMEREAREKIAKQTGGEKINATMSGGETKSSQAASGARALTCSICGIENAHTSETHSDAVQTRIRGVIDAVEASGSSNSGLGTHISAFA